MISLDNPLILQFLREEKLPQNFVSTIQNFYLPLVQHLINLCEKSGLPLIVGINGAQGTGKSTLSNLITLIMEQQHLRCANLSLDDFYLGRAERAELARRSHPLFTTRGVPGTHNLELAIRLLDQLGDPRSKGLVKLPRFDKSLDEPLPDQLWSTVELPVNVVILEGWFVGATAQYAAELDTPINALEAEHDPDGSWRRQVNENLNAYQSLFSRLNLLIMLQAPSFECVYKWRSLQEQKLATRAGTAGTRVMDPDKLQRFIQHFERLTRHCLSSLPSKADLIFHLDEHHQITHQTDRLQ